MLPGGDSEGVGGCLGGERPATPKDLDGCVPCQDKIHLISDAIFVIGDLFSHIIFSCLLSNFNQHIVPIFTNQDMPKRIFFRSKAVDAPNEGHAVATGTLRVTHRLASFQALSLD